MLKNIFAGLIAAALIAAPLPMLAAGAVAQTRQDRTAGQAEESQADADTGATGHARTAEEMRRRMEGGQGRRQDRKGNEVAAVLERVQQAAEAGG